MIKKPGHNQQGYTLIELAISMVVISFILAGGFAAYKYYTIEQEREATRFTMLRIQFALSDFKNRFGRLPCPAAQNLPRSDPDYGREGDCTDTSVAPGTCTNGICVERGIRQIEIAGGAMVYPRVRRGGIPFRDINLTEDEYMDGYGGQISYAVTEILTDWPTFDPRDGGIEIIDGQDPSVESMTDPPGSALYFAFSHGPDNIGAYNSEGVVAVPCEGPMFDVKNCDTEVNPLAEYRYTWASSVAAEPGGSSLPPGPGPGPSPPGAVNLNTHYDDIVAYEATDLRPVWKRSDVAGNENDAHDLIDPTEVVRIRTNIDTEKVNVGGNVRASDNAIVTGNVADGTLCNDLGTDCFAPSDIGGPVGMPCPAGQVANGIGGRALRCTPPQSICDPGEYMSGIVGGVPQCTDIPVPVTCASTTRTICGSVRTISSSSLGAVVTITGGASRSQSYTCTLHSGSGVWINTSNSGVCTCTPSSNTVTNPAGSCGPGYSGSTTTTTTRVCPSGVTSSTTDRAACVCQPGTETRTQACPSGQTGAITQNRTVSCPSGAPVFGPWTTTSNTCACVNRPAQTRTQACPPNHSGSITEERTWNLSTCNWNGWVQTSNTCTCNVNTENRDVSCAAPLTGTIEQSRTSQCPSGGWGAWTDISNNCTCANRNVTRPGPACPPGEVGTITEGRTVDCNDAPVTPWAVISNTCAPPPTCRWTTNGSSTGIGNAGPVANSSCTCGDSPRTCKIATSIPGQFLLYDCRCQ